MFQSKFKNSVWKFGEPNVAVPDGTKKIKINQQIKKKKHFL